MKGREGQRHTQTVPGLIFKNISCIHQPTHQRLSREGLRVRPRRRPQIQPARHYTEKCRRDKTTHNMFFVKNTTMAATAPVSSQREVGGCRSTPRATTTIRSCHRRRWRTERGKHGRRRRSRGKDARPTEQPRFLGRETEVRVAAPTAAATFFGSCRHCSRLRSGPGITTFPLGCYRASRRGQCLLWVEDAVTVRFFHCREEWIRTPPRDGGTCSGKGG